MFPAPAGMSPAQLLFDIELKHVPRTRGDEPDSRSQFVALTQCSPHPRG